MKRSGFKRPTTPVKRLQVKSKLKKVRKGTVKLEGWIKSIPESPAHGSGTLQKRLWRVISDYVRIRDYYRYKGVCVATGVKIPHWRAGNAGHFISYSKGNGIFKFDPSNIHLQSARSNAFGQREEWQTYEATLIERYGIQYVNELEDKNRTTPLKFTNEQLINLLVTTLKDMGKLREQPEYYPRVINLLSELQV